MQVEDTMALAMAVAMGIEKGDRYESMKERDSSGFDDEFCMRGMRRRDQVIPDSQISVLSNKVSESDNMGREARLEAFGQVT